MILTCSNTVSGETIACCVMKSRSYACKVHAGLHKRAVKWQWSRVSAGHRQPSSGADSRSSKDGRKWKVNETPERGSVCVTSWKQGGQDPILRGKGSTVMMVISEARIILDCPRSHRGGHSLNTLPELDWRRTPRKMQIAKSGSEHMSKVRDNWLGFP